MRDVSTSIQLLHMSAIWRQAASNRYIDLALSDDPMNAHGDPGVDAYIRKIREAKRWPSFSSGVQPFPLSKSPLRGGVSRNGDIKSISTALLRESVRIVVWRTLWRLLWVMEGRLVLMGGGGSGRLAGIRTYNTEGESAPFVEILQCHMVALTAAVES